MKHGIEGGTRVLDMTESEQSLHICAVSPSLTLPSLVSY